MEKLPRHLRRGSLESGRRLRITQNLFRRENPQLRLHHLVTWETPKVKPEEPKEVSDQSTSIIPQEPENI